METKTVVKYNGGEYRIAPTRFSIADVEEEFGFSFLKPKQDTFADVFKYATMMVLAGCRPEHPKMDYETARNIADALFNEAGMKEGSEMLATALREAINPTTGAKKTAMKR